MSSPPNPTVAVVNESTVVTASDVAATILALQHQVTYDFRPVWGRGCHIVSASSIPSGAWGLVILDDSDQAGALGYHDWTPGGQPLAKVFAKTDQQYGADWHVTASHELLEMLGDPWIDTAVQVGTSTFYALEVGDACEADVYGYPITVQSGTAQVMVTVSDFVYPSWFSRGAPGPYDHKGHIGAPLRLLPGGYIGEYVCGQGWSQKTAMVGTAPHSRRLELRRNLHA